MTQSDFTPGTAGRSSGAYRQNKQASKVLEAAKDVFIREGAAAFSARRVAKAASLGLSSVQHIFPTTESLLTAMLEHVSDGYEAAYRETAEKLPFNPQARLNAAIDFLLQDVCKPEQRNFWFGFWALSCHNEHAKELLKGCYRHHLSNLAAFIGAARPELPERRSMEVATHVAAFIEGLLIFAHIADRNITVRTPLLQNARQTILRLVMLEGEAPKAT